MKLMVIAAISRETSSTYIVGRHATGICEEHGAEVTFVTPGDLGLPVNDGNVPADLPAAQKWREMVAIQDAFIWVSPEFHGAMTGGLKNLFDHLPKDPMRRSVVGLCAVGGGVMAALNTLDGMSIVARSLGAWVNPKYCAYNSTEVKDGLDAAGRRRLEHMCVTVIDAARRLTAPWPAGTDDDDHVVDDDG